MPLLATVLVITPVPELITTPPLLLLQAPLEGVLFSVVPCPAQKLIVPPIVVGTTFTVTTAPIAQLVPSVYEMVAFPDDEPVTTPEAGSIGAWALLLVQVPPAGVLFRVVNAPTQKLNGPVMAVGNGFTVTMELVEPHVVV